MFSIIQSNDTRRLAHVLTHFYKTHTKDIFEEFVVIVPAKVLEEWLKKIIAQELGISSLFATQFWGQYQWQLIAKVLEADSRYLASIGREHERLQVPEMAVLSASVIRWRLFARLARFDVLATIINDENHPVHVLLSPLMNKQQNNHIAFGELWRFCDSLARLYVGYLTERTDWLLLWANGKAVDVEQLIAKKDLVLALYDDVDYLNQTRQTDDEKIDETDETHRTPEWLKEHYKTLERALAFLWQDFAWVYQYRVSLEARFWQVLDNPNHPACANDYEILPKKLYLFTVQQLPKIELEFLQRLSLYTDVVLLHFNPSMMFWADIVDKQWLLTQTIINPKQVYLKDYGHGLLSRLGKSSRETFAMLAEMSGGGRQGKFEVHWHDIFDETLANTAPKTLLERLKADILMLDSTQEVDSLQKEVPVAHFCFDETDDSLVIHKCHSLKRQLEVARLLIGQWLNGVGSDGRTRQLADIAIMLPDVQKNYDLIRSVFGQAMGIDGLTLPAKITGVVDESTHKLWRAILGVYELSSGRLYFDEFYEWLMNDYVHTAFGMTFEMARRACELLMQAGFVRGLDEAHLKQTLHDQDFDFRRTLSFAIDRLSLSLAMGFEGVSDVLYPFEWTGGFVEKTQMMAGVQLEDKEIVQVLSRIYLALIAVRGQYEQTADMIAWLIRIEQEVIHRYFYGFRETQHLKSIFDAINAMKASVRANKSSYFENRTGQKAPKDRIELALKFVLDALSETILAQQISAEPAGVITFGRFGSLRGIDFGLVIMLGMNLSEFPRTEPVNRFDLKKAGLPRRGDRISEDDDNGVFLEAILQARENCWIFYNEQSDDGAALLPASPVSELIAFLKAVHWQDKTFDEIEPYLIRAYAPTPFHEDNFEVNASSFNILPPPPIWQNVYESMKLMNKNKLHGMIDLPASHDIENFVHNIHNGLPNLSGSLSLSHMISAIKNPAKAYLLDKIYIADDDEKDINEPLGLNNLSDYKLTHHLAMSDESILFYDTLLPSGVARQTLINEKIKAIANIEADYKTYLEQLSIPSKDIELANKIIVLPSQCGQISLTATIPNHISIWHNLRLQRFGMDKWVECYLLHLCWQIHLSFEVVLPQENNNELPLYSSLWYFCKEVGKEVEIISFLPLARNEALIELKKWLVFYELIKSYPICLTPKIAKIYLDNKENMVNNFDESIFSSWVAKPYKDDYISINNSHHKYWKIILGKTKAMTALKEYFPIVDELYDNLLINSHYKKL